MRSKPAREHGVLAGLLSRLRGDRYMVDAWPVAREPEPTSAPVAAATPATLQLVADPSSASDDRDVPVQPATPRVAAESVRS